MLFRTLVVSNTGEIALETEVASKQTLLVQCLMEALQLHILCTIAPQLRCVLGIRGQL